jgi:uncharacterized pyridoxal phosphate-containing UPF0001 family protein
MSDLLEENYHSIQKQIALSAEKVGRDPATVRMLAVSKKMEAERIRVIWRLGHRLFGENRVQEAKVKIPEMPVGGEWHFIGGLQTNKAKDAVECFDVVESVDRLELAAELQKRLELAGKKMRIMMELNVGGEAAKHGCSPEGVGDLLK